MKVILIEDDEKISNFISKGLKEEFCNVDAVSRAKDGLYLANMHNYDVMILDWMLPDMDGLSVIKLLRTEHNYTPILMLTAKDGLDDRVSGLEHGADDYMTKPFSFQELVARIKALHRRNRQQTNQYYQTGDLILDPLKREVKRADKLIDLTIKEFKLLEYLFEHKGRIISTTMILEHIWNMQDEVQSNVVNVTMYHLRKKIDKGHSVTLIETIRGSGYRIKDV